MSDIEKRTWVYVGPPDMYEIAGCKCGNHDTQWSEFKGHLWCDKCNADFVPEHNGVFDGPIPVATCGMLGITFDRLNLETGKVEPFTLATNDEPTESEGPAAPPRGEHD